MGDNYLIKQLNLRGAVMESTKGFGGEAHGTYNVYRHNGAIDNSLLGAFTVAAGPTVTAADQFTRGPSASAGAEFSVGSPLLDVLLHPIVFTDALEFTTRKDLKYTGSIDYRWGHTNFALSGSYQRDGFTKNGENNFLLGVSYGKFNID